MDLNTAWFILFAVLIVGYAVLDGFDLGVGVLHLFSKTETERDHHVEAIAPVWDGNEVWLLTAGGALFAAFPPVYATVFSGYYLALMLLLAGLIMRAVSLEFRHAHDSPRWVRSWDWAFGLGSLVPALLFGVAVGNILRGLPVGRDASWHGSFLGLLNPHALIVGLTGLVLFTLHGATYLRMKTEGDLASRLGNWIPKLWGGFLVAFAVATLATWMVAPGLLGAGFGRPLAWLFVAMFVAAAGYLPTANRADRRGHAFLCSAALIVSSIGLPAVSMFPVLVPSSLDTAFSLTIYNASSSQKTLTIMLVIALVGMPLVIGYTAIVYRIFRGKVGKHVTY